MPTPSDKAQFQARAIQQGKHKLPHAEQEIMEQISRQFEVKALDFSCETRTTSNGSQQQLFHLILETVEDVKQMQSNRSHTTMVTEQFLEYYKSANRAKHILDSHKMDVLPLETHPLPEIIVTYRPLKELGRETLQEMLEDEKRTILNTYESVWTISQAVVFYFTDAQIQENLTNGISAKINAELEQAIQKYDFQSGSSYRFDSKESFERDYEGNWYYYWK